MKEEAVPREELLLITERASSTGGHEGGVMRRRVSGLESPLGSVVQVN
jgi:hypothetical protein